MTDTLHAIFYRTWLLDCDFCGNRVRLPWPDLTTVDRAAWQRFINAWKDEHHGHVYIDTVPSTRPGPLTVTVDDARVVPCEDAS